MNIIRIDENEAFLCERKVFACMLVYFRSTDCRPHRTFFVTGEIVDPLMHMPRARVFSPRAEPHRRGAADEGVDAAAGYHDDGHRCEHAHDEDDVRRLPSSSDAGCDDLQLSGLAGVQMRSHVGSRRDGVDDDDDDDDYDDDDGVVFPPASDKSDDEKEDGIAGAKASSVYRSAEQAT